MGNGGPRRPEGNAPRRAGGGHRPAPGRVAAAALALALAFPLSAPPAAAQPGPLRGGAAGHGTATAPADPGRATEPAGVPSFAAASVDDRPASHRPPPPRADAPPPAAVEAATAKTADPDQNSRRRRPGALADGASERTAPQRGGGDGGGDDGVGGDGRAAAQDREPAGAARTSGAETLSGARVWPLRAGAFDFSQAFGCVPHLGGFYPSTAGCPGDAPGFHTGIDLAAPAGTRFYAAASGWVTEAGLDRAVGLANTRILIQHDGRNDGYATEYLHWRTAYVEPGDYVRAGEPIGEVGSVGYSTGPHLHFSVVDLDADEHVDPSRWLPRDRDTGAYLGLPRGAEERTFRAANKPVPDYADPAPPPLPRRERVPAADLPAPADDRADDDRSPRSEGEDPPEREQQAPRARQEQPDPPAPREEPGREEQSGRAARPGPDPTEEPAAEAAAPVTGRDADRPRDEPPRRRDAAVASAEDPAPEQEARDGRAANRPTTEERTADRAPAREEPAADEPVPADEAATEERPRGEGGGTDGGNDSGRGDAQRSEPDSNPPVADSSADAYGGGIPGGNGGDQSRDGGRGNGGAPAEPQADRGAGGDGAETDAKRD